MNVRIVFLRFFKKSPAVYRKISAVLTGRCINFVQNNYISIAKRRSKFLKERLRARIRMAHKIDDDFPALVKFAVTGKRSADCRRVMTVIVYNDNGITGRRSIFSNNLTAAFSAGKFSKTKANLLVIVRRIFSCRTKQLVCKRNGGGGITDFVLSRNGKIKISRQAQGEIIFLILHAAELKVIVAGSFFSVRNKFYIRTFLTGNFSRFYGAGVISTVDKFTVLRKLADIVNKRVPYIFVRRIIILMVTFNACKNYFLRTERHKMTLIFARFGNKKVTFCGTASGRSIGTAVSE